MYTTGKTKLISFLLAIMMVVGCVPAFAIGAVAEEAQTVYYLKGGAAEGDGSEAAPYGTLAEVVAALEAAGLNVAGNEVTVKVIAPAEGENGNYGGDQALYFNPASSWGPDSDDQWNALQGGKPTANVTAHKATLVFESAAEDVRPIIWMAHTEQDRFKVLRLGGPTVFSGVDLGINRSAGAVPVFASGYDVEFEDVIFRYNNEGNTEATGSAVEIYGGIFQANANGAGNGGGGTIKMDAATLNRTKYLSPLGWAVDIVHWDGWDPVPAVVQGSHFFTDEVKFVLDAGTLADFAFSFVGGRTEEGVTFEDNVNIVLNGTNIKSFYTSSTQMSIADGKAVQIIYNDGAYISSDSFSTLPRYDIHVEEGGALDTTSETGVYSVTFPEGKTIAQASGDNGTYYSVGDTLTVGKKGTYNVTFLSEMPELSATYYVKGGATDGDGSEAAPFGSLEAVVADLNTRGINAPGAEITIKVINSDDDAYLGANALYYNPYGWTESGSYCSTLTKHAATLIIESADPEDRALVFGSYGNKDTLYASLRLSGPVVFRNIDLATSRSSGWMESFCNGFSASFENVGFYYNDGVTAVPKTTVGIYQGGYNHNNGAGVEEGGTLTVDAGTLAKLDMVTSSGWSENNNWYHTSGYQSFDNDVKVVVTGESLGYLRVGGANSAKRIEYFKNLNLILNGTAVADLYNRNDIAQFTEGHAMQIIYNDGASIAKETNVYEGLYRYDIFVEEGGALDTTDVAGTYAVTRPEGKKYAVATAADGEIFVSSGDTLTVGEPGVYNVTFANRYEGQPYYIQGGATGTGESEESPAGTMSALVAQIEADGNNVAGKEIVVKLMNGSGTFAYNSESGSYKIVPHNATLIFEKYDSDTTAHLWVTYLNGSRDETQFLRLGGPTVMRNISLRSERTYSDWIQHFANGNDWTLENVTFLGKGGEKLTGTNIMISHGSRNRDGSDRFNVGTGAGGTVIVDQATCNNNISNYLDIAGDNVGGETFTNDVKVVSGSDYYGSGVRLGSGKTTKYMKNVNVVLNGTTAPSMPASGASFGEGAALQIIYNNGAYITDKSAIANFTKYEIFVENIEGAALDTTAVAGTYSVTYPDEKTIAYFYAVDASGNYDGLTPVYYTTADTITVASAGNYEVGFAATVSDINVEIVNDFTQFDGWVNNEAEGTLTPIAAASNTVDTDVSAIDGTIIYTADVTIGASEKAIITATGDVAANDIVEIVDGGMKIGGFTVAGEFATGTYGVKLTVAADAKAVVVEVTKPDGTVIRRGNDLMLAGNTAFTTITVKTSAADAVANAEAVAADIVLDDYTINEEEPVLTGFDANVYNLVTSFNGDGKTTRIFTFTAKADFVADATLAIKYNVAGSDEVIVVDAVKKTEYTTYEDIDFFEVKLSGLTAGTTYEYQIGKKDSEDWSNTYSFTTESENEPGFSFITISDTQGEAWNGRGFMYAQAALNEALEDVQNPAFILNAGDVVEGRSSAVPEDANIETMWEQYFKAMGDTVKSIPHFAAMGNHDYMGHGSDYDYLFNLHFTHSDNGIATFPNWDLDNYYDRILKVVDTNESTYSFDYDNAHFTVINTGPSGGTDPWYLGAQKSWIEADITGSDAQWKIVVIHQPAYDANGLNSVWANYEINKFFEENGVDLVIEGHAHYNTRTYPMMNGEPVRTTGNPDVITKGEGTVYSIVGSTTTNHDKLKDNLNEDYVTVFSPAAEMPVYATVDVTSSSLTYTVKQLDGFVVDKFVIEGEDVDFTITAEATEGGVVTGGGVYDEAEEVTLTATADDGYKFLGWYEGETLVSEDAELTIVVAEDKTYTAKFELIPVVEYTIDAITDPAEAGLVSGTGVYEEGTVVTLTAEAADGYVFAGWYLDEELVSEEAAIEVTADADKTYTAKFEVEIIEYTVIAEADPADAGTVTGGGVVGAGTQVTFTATANDGYNFIGWYLGEELVSEDETFVVTATEDATYTAKFELIPVVEYTITAEATEGGTAEGTTTVVEGEEVTLTATANEGYEFAGWYLGEELYSTDAEITVIADADKTFTAKFEVAQTAPTEYTITAVADPADYGTVTGGGTVVEGTEVTLTATATNTAKYKFLGWYDGETKVSADTTFVVTAEADKTYTAKFVKYNGDVDGNSRVDLRDYQALFKYVKNKDASALDLTVADIDVNGRVNLRDYQALFKYVKGKLSTDEQNDYNLPIKE